MNSCYLFVNAGRLSGKETMDSFLMCFIVLFSLKFEIVQNIAHLLKLSLLPGLSEIFPKVQRNKTPIIYS